jgi:hypothetical protein
VTLFATIMEADMVPLALGVDKGSFVQVTESMLAPKAMQPQPPKPVQAAPKPKEPAQVPSRHQSPGRPASKRMRARKKVHTGRCPSTNGCQADDRNPQGGGEGSPEGGKYLLHTFTWTTRYTPCPSRPSRRSSASRRSACCPMCRTSSGA